MIGRIFSPSASFARACHYVTQDRERAQVLYQEGVRGHDCRLTARDFEMVARLHDTIGKPVFHAVLTFHREEKLDDAAKIELGLKYLDGVGMVNTQRLIAAHHDARHEHIHLLANRIDYDGNPIHNFPEVLRGRDTVERLNQEYGLVPVAAKNLRQTNFDALDRSDIRKYVVYRNVKEALGQAKSLDELELRLEPKGIGMRYRLDESGRRVGVSFLYRNEAFRGTEIDRELSLGKLEKTVSQRQELSQWEEQKREIGKQLQQEEERVLEEKEALRQAVLKQQEALKHQEALKQQEALKEREALKQREGLRQQEEQVGEEPRLRQGPRLRLH
ncbi:MAG TPA: relaxase/mobilization nuclease domain-containing protein [Puia sp.]|nr:relaxase/mobilization nuclease domain-containing protein [Puia sp.]